MLPPLKQVKLWLLILCLIGNGFLPLGALASTRIWSPAMSICFSGQSSQESQDSKLGHPFCCCHFNSADTALPTPDSPHPWDLPYKRAGLVGNTNAPTGITVRQVRARGPPLLSIAQSS